jgi:hypothetical protein
LVDTDTGHLFEILVVVIVGVRDDRVHSLSSLVVVFFLPQQQKRFGRALLHAGGFWAFPARRFRASTKDAKMMMNKKRFSL